MVDCHPLESIVDLGCASVDKVSSGENLQCHPVKNVMFLRVKIYNATQ